MKQVILILFVLSALTAVSEAAPLQTLGGLRTSDAYLIPHRSVKVTLVGYYRNVERPSYVDQDKNGLHFYGMVGVGMFDWAEVAFFGGDYVYFFDAKLRLLKESKYIPQIAVGMDNILSPVNRRRSQDYRPYWDPEIGDEGAPSSVYDPHDLGWIDHPDKVDYEYFSPYFVFSKEVYIGVELSMGMGANSFTGTVPSMLSGVFASVEVRPFDEISFMGEYDGKDFNAGIKYSYRNLDVRLGAEAVEDLAKGSEGNGYENNLRLALGLAYEFSF